ncbi:MAG: GMP synthase [Gammaproteobacteria bacterium]
MDATARRKPILIVRHAACDEPGYLCRRLDHLGVTYRKCCLDLSEALPADPREVAGILLLGAPVSVYDPLPWIEGETDFLLRAAEQEIPLFGICFGAQLMSHALGGEVCPAPSMQIGWHPVTTLPAARHHAGLARLPERFEGFEWHGDTFTPPPGAEPLFGGGCIEQQGFIDGNRIAVQFHPEVTERQIEAWIRQYEHCLPPPSPCVQSPEEIRRDLEARLTRQRRVADALLGCWLSMTGDERFAESGALANPPPESTLRS